jgi:membrane protein required for colicin V production
MLRCTMNPLDYFLIAVFIYCLIRGIFRGLVKELSSIIGVLGGLYAAYTYYRVVGKWLSGWIANTAYLNIISCLIIFLGVYLVVSILGVIIKYFMNIVFLGWTDRICGAGLGALKGILITVVFITILATFLPKNTSLLRESLIARHMAWVSKTLPHAALKDDKKPLDL